MTNISIFQNFSHFMGNFTYDSIYESIRFGEFKDEVEHIRQLLAEGKTEEAGQLKKQLPAFTPSGTFDKGRKAEFLQEYSQVISLDFDHVAPDRIGPLHRQAEAIPYTRGCFLSPGGLGLKILVRVSSGAADHAHAFNQVADYYERQLGLPLDRSGKDVCRLCFLSYDPELYSNPDCTTFPVDIPPNRSLTVLQFPPSPLPPYQSAPCALSPEPQTPGSIPSFSNFQIPKFSNSNPLPVPVIEGDYKELFSKAVDFTKEKLSFEQGSRNNFVYLLANNCNRYGIPADVALPLIDGQYGYDSREVKRSVESAYNSHAAEFGKAPETGQLEQMERLEQLARVPTDDDFSDKLFSTPFIPAGLYNQLPELLQKGCDPFKTQREKDLFLTGALAVLGGCMENVTGTYDQRTVYPTIFTFAIAPAASGKSALYFSKELAMGYHRRLVRESKELQSQYQAELENYKDKSRKGKKGTPESDEEPPVEPGFKVLFIPANSSSAAVIGHLGQSGGAGIICETEADTLANSFKQDWGGFSDLLRKAFHHEPVTYSRKTNHEFIEVENPRIAVALSGTPSQVSGLISSAEDGMFSRFVFYLFKVDPVWRDVSPANSVNLTDHFTLLSAEVEKMIDYLHEYPTRFSLTHEQWDKLNSSFALWLKEVSAFVSEDAGSTVKRLALIVFRIAMILTAIRKFENGVIDERLTCSDEDFATAFTLAEVYKQHAILMLSTLPCPGKDIPSEKKRAFFEALPSGREFTRAEAGKTGETLHISQRLVTKYLRQLVGTFLKQPSYGCYSRMEHVPTVPTVPSVPTAL